MRAPPPAALTARAETPRTVAGKGRLLGQAWCALPVASEPLLLPTLSPPPTPRTLALTQRALQLVGAGPWWGGFVA